MARKTKAQIAEENRIAQEALRQENARKHSEWLAANQETIDTMSKAIVSSLIPIVEMVEAFYNKGSLFNLRINPGFGGNILDITVQDDMNSEYRPSVDVNLTKSGVVKSTLNWACYGSRDLAYTAEFIKVLSSHKDLAERIQEYVRGYVFPCLVVQYASLIPEDEKVFSWAKMSACDEVEAFARSILRERAARQNVG